MFFKRLYKYFAESKEGKNVLYCIYIYKGIHCILQLGDRIGSWWLLFKPTQFKLCRINNTCLMVLFLKFNSFYQQLPHLHVINKYNREINTDYVHQYN